MYDDLQDPMTEDKAVISMHVDVDEVSLGMSQTKKDHEGPNH